MQQKKLKIQKISDLLENISCKAVLGMAVLILALLTFWAGKYTHMPSVDLENAKAYEYADNILKNILCFITTAAVMFGISKLILTKDEEKNKKRVQVLAIIATILVGIIGAIWVAIHTYYPYHDQLQVVNDAMLFLQGDYSDLKIYMEIYPHQLGLAFFYEILFWIFPTFEAIYYFHIIWLMVIVYFTYAATEELFGNSHISLYSLFISACFVPMYFYVNYAYGDLGTAACGVASVWLAAKLCKTVQKRYGILLLAVMTFGCLIRMNALVVAVAICISFLIFGFKKMDWRILVLAILVLVLPIAAGKAVVAFYEARADIEMAEGAPYILHIAMGMQESYEGPGYYNAYNLTTYVNNGKDAAYAKELGKEYIRGRLAEMITDPAATKDFYRLKILQQWNEPSFSGEISTKTFETTPRNFVLDIYYGAIQNFLRVFRNLYIFVLYAGALIGAISRLFISKKEDGIWKNLICITLVGGFLFSILWENKSRYVMPYVVMLMPFTVLGIYELQQYTRIVFSFIRKLITNQIASKTTKI